MQRIANLMFALLLLLPLPLPLNSGSGNNNSDARMNLWVYKSVKTQLTIWGAKSDKKGFIVPEQHFQQRNGGKWRKIFAWLSFICCISSFKQWWWVLIYYFQLSVVVLHALACVNFQAWSKRQEMLSQHTFQVRF